MLRTRRNRNGFDFLCLAMSLCEFVLFWPFRIVLFMLFIAGNKQIRVICREGPIWAMRNGNDFISSHQYSSAFRILATMQTKGQNIDFTMAFVDIVWYLHVKRMVCAHIPANMKVDRNDKR